MNFVLNDYEELICLCLRHSNYLDKERISYLFNRVDEKILFSDAEINGVTSIVADALIKTFGLEKMSNNWIEEYNKVSKMTGSYMDALDFAANVLSKKNIKMVALKNSGITRGLYPNYGSSPMGDIDVLVLEDDFDLAHKLLTKNGFKLKFRSALEEDTIESAIKSGGAEYSYKLPNGENLWFELQFRPVAGRWITAEREPKTVELINHSISISNSAARLLSPEDNLIQVALHTAKHSYVRAPGFRLHTDVDRVVSEQNIDWDIFESKVLNLRVKTAVYFSLALASTLLKTPIPEKTLLTLKPSSLKVFFVNNWLSRVGIFKPDEPKWSKLGYVIFVCLLFDDLRSFVGAIFPNKAELRKLYPNLSNKFWMLGYILRIGNLMFKRNQV